MNCGSFRLITPSPGKLILRSGARESQQLFLKLIKCLNTIGLQRTKRALCQHCGLNSRIIFLIKRKAEKCQLYAAVSLAQDLGIDEERAILTFFDNLGEIFYFQNDSELVKHVIVDTQWLINIVAAFATDKGMVKVRKHARQWREVCGKEKGDVCKAGKINEDFVLSLLIKEA